MRVVQNTTHEKKKGRPVLQTFDSIRLLGTDGPSRSIYMFERLLSIAPNIIMKKAFIENIKAIINFKHNNSEEHLRLIYDFLKDSEETDREYQLMTFRARLFSHAQNSKIIYSPKVLEEFFTQARLIEKDLHYTTYVRTLPLKEDRKTVREDAVRYLEIITGCMKKVPIENRRGVIKGAKYILRQDPDIPKKEFFYLIDRFVEYIKDKKGFMDQSYIYKMKTYAFEDKCEKTPQYFEDAINNKTIVRIPHKNTGLYLKGVWDKTELLAYEPIEDRVYKIILDTEMRFRETEVGIDPKLRYKFLELEGRLRV